MRSFVRRHFGPLVFFATIVWVPISAIVGQWLGLNPFQGASIAPVGAAASCVALMYLVRLEDS